MSYGIIGQLLNGGLWRSALNRFRALSGDGNLDPPVPNLPLETPADGIARGLASAAGTGGASAFGTLGAFCAFGAFRAVSAYGAFGAFCGYGASTPTVPSPSRLHHLGGGPFFGQKHRT